MTSWGPDIDEKLHNSDSLASSSLHCHAARPFSPSSSSMHRICSELAQSQSLSTSSYLYRKRVMRRALRGTMDRVNVLGDDEPNGHTGCVNTLSWAFNGDVLLSGGDDRTVRLWKLDSTDLSTPYPYKCDTVLRTGHKRNIFNTQQLPFSTRIATVAADSQVRIFDVEEVLTSSRHSRKMQFKASELDVRILNCHTGHTKRIVPETPDSLLTVSEDGSVRQHDLRVPHRCRDNCPAPLVNLPFELYSLALSPLAPYLFVVGGDSPYGYLFDRRQVGRVLEAEWGQPCMDESVVTCVRRFGRSHRGLRESRGDHISGVRMAQTNSHEVLLSYNRGNVCLYSVRDEAEIPVSRRPSPPLSLNSMVQNGSLEVGNNADLPPRLNDRLEDILNLNIDVANGGGYEVEENMHELQDMVNDFVEEHNLIGREDEEDEDGDEGGTTSYDFGFPDDNYSNLPVIMPRREFSGHCNAETYKDVNFIGLDDEYVASGSDDGNFFLWDKNTGRLHGVYEGDSAIVNVIENHPTFPLIACSGIDTTIKLFAPTEKQSMFSRLNNADSIMKNNLTRARHSMPILSLFMRYGI